ncbi:hypothetical protein CIG19_07000 [Enterobacterales bacterium CwR94]|nr:hypothetical protein CIG19_07000 [Enterobacterales bacterium CwR94]
MKERPILFSDQRVSALISGQQTQTRRIMKSRVFSPGQDNHEGCFGFDVSSNHLHGFQVLGMSDLSQHCPFGQVGDQLWVRETWRGPVLPPELLEDYAKRPEKFKDAQWCQYLADQRQLTAAQADLEDVGWQTAIHMPRWASRIDLLIRSIRVERLQDISDDDVTAEGIGSTTHFLNHFFTLPGETLSAQMSYKKHWEKVYGANSWNVNPWVWVIEFEKV